MSGYSVEQLDRAAKAVHQVTGGGIPFGKSRRKAGTGATVHARLVAQAALEAATTEVITRPLPATPSTQDDQEESK